MVVRDCGAICAVYQPEREDMTRAITTVLAVTFVAASLVSCGNTVRGMGQDAANTVNATQDAGNRVGNAAAR